MHDKQVAILWGRVGMRADSSASGGLNLLKVHERQDDLPQLNQEREQLTS